MSNTSSSNKVETMNAKLQAAGLGHLIGCDSAGIVSMMYHHHSLSSHACTDAELPAWEAAWDAAKAAADEEAAMLD